MNEALAFLPYVLPILLGGLIGWLTNVLAIKMLFRPLTEKRVFGFRLPLTPGILPRNRGRLAESLGNAVSRELLSPEVIAGRLKDPEFRVSVRAQVSLFFESFLGKPLAFGVSERGTLSRLISDLACSSLRSSSMHALLSGVAASITASLAGLSVRDVLKPETVERAGEALSSRLTESREAIHAAVDRALETPSFSSRNLSDFFPERASDIAERLFLSIYPAGFRALLSWLGSPEARESLAERGREITDVVIARLPTVQKLVISLAGYQQKLHDEMPDIVQDLVEGLRKEGSLPSTSAGLAREVGKNCAKFLDRPLSEIDREAPALRALLHDLIDHVIDSLSRPETRSLARKVLTDPEGKLGSRTLGELYAAISGRDPLSVSEHVAGALESLANRLADALERGSGEGGLPAWIPASLTEMPLGEALGISPEGRESFEAAIADVAIALLGNKAEEITRTVDIRKVVVERVNSMDMEDLERIVLDVMKEQFFWIDIFGGILGSLIGATQVVLSLVMGS